ncbi:hypothetical protein F5890DRAFT_437442 [Lentinula detonsa]|uniref:Uncharacterized protein n=1 Tax=Lentinula detonsa TaxID=2804962 RepID=A0AA38PUH9_9AGAR|nr:hypothetical protein F5890DRAFT_437442 [Lentinula detonsa]
MIIGPGTLILVGMSTSFCLSHAKDKSTRARIYSVYGPWTLRCRKTRFMNVAIQLVLNLVTTQREVAMKLPVFIHEQPESRSRGINFSSEFGISFHVSNHSPYQMVTRPRFLHSHLDLWSSTLFYGC